MPFEKNKNDNLQLNQPKEKNIQINKIRGEKKYYNKHQCQDYFDSFYSIKLENLENVCAA